MIRITTNSVLTNYKSQLLRSQQTLMKRQETVLTQRNFNRYAEDPSAATQAFKLRRIFSHTDDHITNANSLINKFDAAWGALDEVKDLVEQAANDISLHAISDPTASGRQAVSAALKNNAEAIAQCMNMNYGEFSIFAGNDGLNTPFSWDTSGKLLYRGVAVDSGSPAGLPEGTPPNPKDVTAPDGGWGDYYAANDDYKTLVAMTYETAYIDLGFGLKEIGGAIDSASAFDSAICGLESVGFGVDADGDPKNVASLMMQLSGVFSRCDPETGAYANSADAGAATRLTGKLQEAMSQLTTSWVDLDGRAAHLQSTKTRLEDYADTVNEQILSIEQADLASAITDYSWADYCYKAALQSGQDVISQSLFDYMR